MIYGTARIAGIKPRRGCRAFARKTSSFDTTAISFPFSMPDHKNPRVDPWSRTNGDTGHEWWTVERDSIVETDTSVAAGRWKLSSFRDATKTLLAEAVSPADKFWTNFQS